MVRVVGNIRDYEGNRHVLVFEVFPIEDFNQLTNHLLDVILTHCKHAKGPIPVGSLLHATDLFAQQPYYTWIFFVYNAGFCCIQADEQLLHVFPRPR